MALDFDALRKKLNSLQGQNNRSVALWKPPEGQSVIRIVPWKDKPENPFVELYFHYLGGKTQLSPLTVGDPDPIAEFADKLRSTGDQDDWKHARQFSPKLRTFAPIIVRGEEEKGVRFWGFGKTVYKEILGVIDDDDWGDITDPRNGHDIGIEFIPQKKSKTNFAETTVRVKPKSTPVSTSAEEMEKYLTEQPDVFEIFTAPSYNELKDFLEKYLNPDADTSVTTELKTPTEEKGSSDLAAALSVAESPKDDELEAALTDDEDDGDNDVADEFEKLFNS
jgi:hypothetical protein